MSGLPGMEGIDIEIYSTSYIKGNKQRTDMTTKMAGGTPGMPGSGEGMKTIIIIDLDKDAMWTLMPDAKTYSEINLKKMREMMKGLGSKEESEETMPEIDVKESKNTKVINGFECKQVVITMKSKMKDTETGEEVSTTYTFDLWLTEKMEGMNEIESFAVKASEAMTGKKIGGMDYSQIFGNLKNILGEQYGDICEAINKKMEEVKGYPILTTFKIEVQGREESLPYSGSTEIKSVKVRPVPASKFKIPEGYTKIPTPGMEE